MYNKAVFTFNAKSIIDIIHVEEEKSNEWCHCLLLCFFRPCAASKDKLHGFGIDIGNDWKCGHISTNGKLHPTLDINRYVTHLLITGFRRCTCNLQLSYILVYFSVYHAFFLWIYFSWWKITKVRVFENSRIFSLNMFYRWYLANISSYWNNKVLNQLPQ